MVTESDRLDSVHTRNVHEMEITEIPWFMGFDQWELERKCLVWVWALFLGVSMGMRIRWKMGMHVMGMGSALSQ